MSAIWPPQEELIQGMCERNGKTPEQNRALLEVLGSALNRRAGDGATLDKSEARARMRTFLGGTEGDD